jgi:hypothetical protein
MIINWREVANVIRDITSRCAATRPNRARRGVEERHM